MRRKTPKYVTFKAHGPLHSSTLNGLDATHGHLSPILFKDGVLVEGTHYTKEMDMYSFGTKHFVTLKSKSLL